MAIKPATTTVPVTTLLGERHLAKPVNTIPAKTAPRIAHSEVAQSGASEPVETLLDEKQTADLINVSPRTLQAWRRTGEGPPYIKLGGPKGAVRYVPAMLGTWLAERVVTSTAQSAAGDGVE